MFGLFSSIQSLLLTYQPNTKNANSDSRRSKPFLVIQAMEYINVAIHSDEANREYGDHGRTYDHTC